MSSILVPAPTFVTSERGGPVPPQDVLKELKKIEPALSLRFMPDFDASRWAFTWEWPETDPRWSRVRSQEIPRESAYDIIGYLPLQCSIDQAKGYVETHLKNYPREEVSALRAKVAHWNEVEVAKEQTAELITDTLDDASRQSRQPKGWKMFGGKK